VTRPAVLKFGGTSLADAPAIERAVAIVRARLQLHPVVVVSAMAGVTDALLAAVARAGGDEVATAVGEVEPVLERYAAAAADLLPGAGRREYHALLAATRGELAADLARVTRDPAAPDAVAVQGERLSAALVTAALAAGGVPACEADARRCIVSDTRHGKAEALIPETETATRATLEPLLAAGQVPVLGGFMAATPEGVTTTLGRGGSDYSASLVGAALSAGEIQIWTDVSGVLTADPRVVPAARTIPRLSFAEASELAYFGAKVLHPKTILPAIRHGIPVRILNTLAPEDGGTRVTGESEVVPHTVKAIAHKSGVAIVNVSSLRMLGAYGFLRALFEVFERHRTVVDLVATSEVSVSLSLDDTATLPAILKDLAGLGEASVETGRAIICVVGEGLRGTPGIAARVFSTIRDINVSLISLGASRINITFVVEEKRAAEAVRRLHAALFESALEEVSWTSSP
jgi:aspartate kinase